MQQSVSATQMKTIFSYLTKACIAYAGDIFSLFLKRMNEKSRTQTPDEAHTLRDVCLYMSKDIDKL